MINWTFEKSHPMGGAAGQAFNNPLLGTSPPESLLAREAIQNSCDAAYPRNSKVKVTFKKKTLRGSEKIDFIQALGIDRNIKPRIEYIGLSATNCINELNEPEKPLNLLYIEDENTHGLYGDPHDGESHFHRLLLSLGDDSKAYQDESTGGSYGFGKSVYSANSRIHTIVAYSAFSAIGNGDCDSARVMCCSFFKNHKIEEQAFTGRAWMGTADDSSEKVYPLENVDAHELALTCGFEARHEGKRGTSILIIDCSVSMDDLRNYIEDCWWPRICDDALDIELYDENRRLPPPRPRGREELRPFIECYDMAINRSQATGSHQRFQRFNRLNNRELGSCGFQTLDQSLSENDDIQPYLNRIALIRGLRMVVAYAEFGRTTPSAVGVFFADPAIDRYLKLSETTSHDKWDPSSPRLTEMGGDAKECVKAVMDRLKQQFRRFQNEALPPQTRGDRRLRLFERDFGELFRPPGGPVPPPRGDIDPISINFHRQPQAIQQDGQIFTNAAFSVALKEDANIESADVILSVKIPILEDDNARDGEAIPITITQQSDGSTITAVEEARIPLQLIKDERQRFTIRSDPYD
ncbi:MAG: hypothetical protein KKD24_02075, partial [Proteobacteria bacterium]|nr:hypothetical protein [Pseudomonadota bacterium]